MVGVAWITCIYMHLHLVFNSVLGFLPENACSSRTPSLSSLHTASMEKGRMTQNSSHYPDCLSLRKTRPSDRFPYVNS